jgi:hypothetical protein
MALSSKQHGWKVTHRVYAGARQGSEGGAPGADRIELGVLLGAGSFGRVYKGRWQGEGGLALPAVGAGGAALPRDHVGGEIPRPRREPQPRPSSEPRAPQARTWP